MNPLIISIFAFVSSLIIYILFRRISVFLWAYTAALLPDISVYFLALFGAKNLGTVLVISRFLGLFLWPLILLVLDLLLIELDFFGYLKPLYTFLPNSIKTTLKFEMFVDKLQNYNAIPKPIRLKTAYKVGFLSILIYLILTYSTELIIQLEAL